MFTSLVSNHRSCSRRRIAMGAGRSKGGLDLQLDECRPYVEERNPNPYGLDVESLAKQHHLTEQQLMSMIDACRVAAKRSDGQLTVDQFRQVIDRIRETNPDLVYWSHDVSDIAFIMCDTDHSDSVDPRELIAAMALFASGPRGERAKLVFKAIDLYVCLLHSIPLLAAVSWKRFCIVLSLFVLLRRVLCTFVHSRVPHTHRLIAPLRPSLNFLT